MGTAALIQNIHFTQKIILIFFLLVLSIYYQLRKNKIHKTKKEDETLFGDSFNKLLSIGSYIYILLFPLMLVFLEYTVSFYLFVTILLSFYTAFFIVFTIITLYNNGSKFWTWLEDNFL